MNENSFVAVGRIERITSTPRSLTLLIGGAGPVKSLVSVQLRDAGLIKLVSTPGTGFATGDIVSVGGRLEYDCETGQNVAVAAPDRVSRIVRAGAGAGLASAAPASSGASFFGHRTRQAPSGHPVDPASIPPMPDNFPEYLTGSPLQLEDVPS
ncbi:hypothetical protein [Massilia alkalitolerans]|uniref:hypothetical protein n=1 Tax=Massilia alkalitolerans TaxID=286638 RepID=UPI0004026D7B|nr:hypothetical protein [Massilia alkalitolerans]